MEHDTLFEFFHSFSRIFIIIPIIILIAGLFIRFNQSFVKTTPKKAVVLSPTVVKEKISTQAAQLSLKGPFVCQFSSQEATASGYIKNSKVYGKVEKKSGTTNILLNNDCFYTWGNASFTGEKICGLKPYISMIGDLPLTNLLGNSGMLPIKTDTIISILNSCKKEEIKNGSIFDVPKNVLFNESKTKVPRL